MPLLITWGLRLLAGPFGKYIAIAAILAATGAALAIGLHEHDQRIRAEDAARVQAATAAQQLADAKANAAALAASLADAEARASRVTTIKTEIARAPVSSGCVASPSVRAALDGLRGAAGPGGGAAGNPGGAAVVPGSTGATKPAP